MPSIIPFTLGAPGAVPHWTPSAKNGVGTAYSANSRVWFTLSHGVLNELFWPHVDSPATRDFEFLVADGESFVHEEKRDFGHRIEMPERGALLYRLTSDAPESRYRLVKEVIANPHRTLPFFETSLSGMSLNPACTFGSAVAAHEWKTLWVYFLGPTLATLLAAEIYQRWRGCHLDGSNYPVEETGAESSGENGTHAGCRP